MKRVERHVEFPITGRKLRRLLAGHVIMERVGEEHDGQQVVIRISPSRWPRLTGQGSVMVSVKWHVWDHGGHVER